MNSDFGVVKFTWDHELTLGVAPRSKMSKGKHRCWLRLVAWSHSAETGGVRDCVLEVDLQYKCFRPLLLVSHMVVFERVVLREGVLVASAADNCSVGLRPHCRLRVRV